MELHMLSLELRYAVPGIDLDIGGRLARLRGWCPRPANGVHSTRPVVIRYAVPGIWLRPWDKKQKLDFFSVSETFLERINTILKDNRAVEAIVEVTVTNNLHSTNNEYEDSRECVRIAPVLPKGGVPNPKPFVFVSR